MNKDEALKLLAGFIDEDWIIEVAERNGIERSFDSDGVASFNCDIESLKWFAEEVGFNTVRLVRDKRMPSSSQMGWLAAQGVDTDVLTAERIMALRIMGKTYVCHDRKGNWQASAIAELRATPSRHGWYIPFRNGDIPAPFCGINGQYEEDWCKSLLNLDTLELVDEGGAK